MTIRLYAWLVLAACFIQLAITMGLAFSVGPLIYHWLQLWNLGQQKTAWAGSINIGLMFLSGPMAATLCAWLDFRLAVLLGSILASLGLLVSSFVPNIDYLYITYGVISGIGFGIVYTLCMVFPAFYFNKHRVLALGVTSAGAGVGNLVFPPLLQLMLDCDGWRSTITWCAAICLQGCVLAMLLKLPPITNQEGGPPPRPPLCNTVVLTNPCFWLFFTCNLFWNTGSIFVSVFLVDFATQTGLTREQGSQLVAVIGVSSVVLRLPMALLADRWHYSQIHLYCMGAVVRGIGTLLLPVIGGFPWAVMCSTLHGSGFGIQLALLYPVILEMFPLQHAPSVGGYGLVSAGIGALVGPPMAGWLYSIHQNYILPFYLGAAMTLCSIIPMYVAWYLTSRTKKYSRQQQMAVNVDKAEQEKDAKIPMTDPVCSTELRDEHDDVDGVKHSDSLLTQSKTVSC